MAHGGTNFEFFNGANTGQNESDYKADLTSYDYVSNICWERCMIVWNFSYNTSSNSPAIQDAPIKESGDVDNPKFKGMSWST